MRAISELAMVLYSSENLQFENMNCESFCCAPLMRHGGSISTTSNFPTSSANNCQLKYRTSQFRKLSLDKRPSAYFATSIPYSVFRYSPLCSRRYSFMNGNLKLSTTDE